MLLYSEGRGFSREAELPPSPAVHAAGEAALDPGGLWAASARGQVVLSQFC